MRSFIRSGVQDQTDSQGSGWRGEPGPVESAAPGGLFIGDHHRKIAGIVCRPCQRFVIGRASGIKITNGTQREIRKSFVEILLIHEEEENSRLWQNEPWIDKPAVLPDFKMQMCAF